MTTRSIRQTEGRDWPGLCPGGGASCEVTRGDQMCSTIKDDFYFTSIKQFLSSSEV